MDIKSILNMISKGEIRFIDYRFIDLRGVAQHFTLSASGFNRDTVHEGTSFDGSSIKGFQNIFDSDLLVKPDLESAFLDPFYERTLVVYCDIYDPHTSEPYLKDPRSLAKRAEKYLVNSGVADTSYWGPEIEFFVLDRMEYSLDPRFAMLNLESVDTNDHVDSDGYPIRTKWGYFPAPPFDKLQQFRSEMTEILESIGIEIEVHHHEVAIGQVEIDMKYDTLLRMADKVMTYKYVARNLALKYAMSATFMPKPIYGDNGSGMHTHQSLFRDGKNVFYDEKAYGKVSKRGHSYIAGLLANLSPLLAITNPTTNSYRRLVPHFEAPTAIAFSKRNRSAAVRIPVTSNNEKAVRFELRCPDPTANPYLAFSAMLLYGLEGMGKNLDPVKLGFGPFDENIWERSGVLQTPPDLFTTITELKKDKILKQSGVFTEEILDSYCDYKFSEAKESMLYPTPADFHFYGDI